LNLGSNGLYPFAPYSNPVLLEKLYRDAYNEDAAALQGRKYHADSNALAKVFDLFSNRPSMPETTEQMFALLLFQHYLLVANATEHSQLIQAT
jgi:hypothetical protein